MDELRELAEIAEDKPKIALIDLFRLLVLTEDQADYVMASHWELIEVCIFGYISAQNLQDPTAKIMQNYHQMSLKLLANIFATPKGRDAMQDEERGQALIDFCAKSFTSINPKVVYHAALVLFNYLLTYQKESKKSIQNLLEAAFKAIDEALQTEGLADEETLSALLLCECRILYKNHEMVTWVEENFKLFFVETHNTLKEKSSSNKVKQSVEDVMSMVNLEEKK